MVKPKPELAKNQIYCTTDCKFNRQYKDGAQIMLACDVSNCNQWFHAECVGLGHKTEVEINNMDY